MVGTHCLLKFGETVGIHCISKNWRYGGYPPYIKTWTIRRLSTTRLKLGDMVGIHCIFNMVDICRLFKIVTWWVSAVYSKLARRWASTAYLKISNIVACGYPPRIENLMNGGYPPHIKKLAIWWVSAVCWKFDDMAGIHHVFKIGRFGGYLLKN